MMGVQLPLPHRRLRPRKPPPALEKHTAIAVADLLRLGARKDVRFSYFPAGELRAKKTAGLLQRLGVQRGWPDFIILDRHGVAFIELKRGSLGVLSEEQASFRDDCQEWGIRHAVCSSYAEAVAALKEWGVLRKGVAA